MKKTILRYLILPVFALLAGATAAAQPAITQLYFDTRASFHQEWADGQYNSQFTGDHFNLNIRGYLTDKLDFRVRQRLNKKVFDERNMFNATDFLYLRWQASPRSPSAWATLPSPSAHLQYTQFLPPRQSSGMGLTITLHQILYFSSQLISFPQPRWKAI